MKRYDLSFIVWLHCMLEITGNIRIHFTAENFVIAFFSFVIKKHFVDLNEWDKQIKTMAIPYLILPYQTIALL